MDWLIYDVFLTPPIDTVRRSKAKQDLRKLASFVQSISQRDLPLTGGFELDRGAELGILELDREVEETDDKILRNVEAINDFVRLCYQMEADGIVDAVTEKLINEVEHEFELLPETGNIKWHAVRAVSGLQELWRRNTGKCGPTRALNPASQFAAYLHDGFDFLELDADHISAFKRWVDVGPENRGP